MPYKDPEKRRECKKQWARRNAHKQAAYYQENREHIRKMQKPNTYFHNYPNASVEDYQKYISTTHCECCGVEFDETIDQHRKCQDHNHDTNTLRGVICKRCNFIEGLVRTEKRANQIAEYINKWD